MANFQHLLITGYPSENTAKNSTKIPEWNSAAVGDVINHYMLFTQCSILSKG